MFDLAAININNVVIDPGSRDVIIDGKFVLFTKTEFQVIYYLSINQGRAICRDELLDKIWSIPSGIETRATDDMIKRIRKKLKENQAQLMIQTVRGYGFIIRELPV